MNKTESVKSGPAGSNSQVRSFIYDNGELQRVQVVRWDDWGRADFVKPEYSHEVFEQFCNIYRNFLIPAAPIVFGRNIMFHADPGEEYKTRSILKDGLRMTRRGPHFKTDAARELWESLESRGCLQTVCGKLPFTKLICVGSDAGFLSAEAGGGLKETRFLSDKADDGSERMGDIRVNASFFIMDPFDCATRYDRVGIPIGLAVKDGKVLNPPLFGREALLVSDSGEVNVRAVGLSELTIEIRGTEYSPGAGKSNKAQIFERPACKRTPKLKSCECDIVIIGTRVEDVVTEGRTDVPASGFVMRIKKSREISPDDGKTPVEIVVGDEVVYKGLEQVCFGVQVGNSIIRDGKVTKGFISRFYNIKKPWQTKYPPSLYPLDFEGARAARMAIGADAEGRPMLVWAEGKGKLGYTPGSDSCGASLSELGEICSELGMYNGVSLDGGGSAQILFNKERELMISDRKPSDNSSAERAVPLGIVIG